MANQKNRLRADEGPGAGTPDARARSVTITLDRYGHLYAGDVHQYVDRLGEAALAARADYGRTNGSAAAPTGTDDDAEIGL